MLDEVLSNLPTLHPVTPRKGERWSWWRLAILALVFIGLSVGIWFFFGMVEGWLQDGSGGFDGYAYIIVFFVSLVATATILFPGPGVMIAASAATHWHPTWVAVASSLGSTLGELTGYCAGYWGSKTVVKKESPTYIRFERWTRRYGMLAVMFVAFVPFYGFDLIGIAAGALRLPVWQFLLAVYIGRLPRGFVETYGWGGLLKYFLGG